MPHLLQMSEALARVCRHLPEDIRVFSVQRVNSKFNARSMCTSRVYEYLVPAPVLGLAVDGGQGDSNILARLQGALAAFVGDRPFHNYTRRCDAVAARMQFAALSRPGK
jgi:tRNA pseudouridine(38-40) synthase